jgi:hypothetical protein
LKRASLSGLHELRGEALVELLAVEVDDLVELLGVAAAPGVAHGGISHDVSRRRGH